LKLRIFKIFEIFKISDLKEDGSAHHLGEDVAGAAAGDEPEGGGDGDDEDGEPDGEVAPGVQGQASLRHEAWPEHCEGKDRPGNEGDDPMFGVEGDGGAVFACFEGDEEEGGADEGEAGEECAADDEFKLGFPEVAHVIEDEEGAGVEHDAHEDGAEGEAGECFEESGFRRGGFAVGEERGEIVMVGEVNERLIVVEGDLGMVEGAHGYRFQIVRFLEVMLQATSA
jgi:hypothetical protein